MIGKIVKFKLFLCFHVVQKHQLKELGNKITSDERRRFFCDSRCINSEF